MATVNGSGISIPNRWIEWGCPPSWMLKSSRWQLRASIDATSRYNFLLFSFQNFFLSEVMLFKAIFIHLFSHFLDHEINLRYFPNQKCHDSNHENSCNDSSEGFLRHKLLSDMVWKSFRYRLPLNYFSFEPMDQPCTSETWSRTQSSWTYKISAEQKWQHGGIRFFWCRWIKLIPNNIRSSCSPRITYKEILADWIPKKSKPYWI